MRDHPSRASCNGGIDQILRSHFANAGVADTPFFHLRRIEPERQVSQLVDDDIGLHSQQCRLESLGVENIDDHGRRPDCPKAIGPIRLAGRAVDGKACFDQQGNKLAPDRTGCAGKENGFGHL